MTISFRCPWCNALCGFGDKYAGRRAKCLTCQKKFLIPGESDFKAKKVIEKNKEKAKPLKGFYKAVFMDSWDAIFSPQSKNTLMHLEILVIFKLLLFCICAQLALWVPAPETFGAVFIFVGLFITFLFFMFGFCCIFGRIIELYITFLDETASDVDQLPPPFNDFEMPIWEHMLKPFLVFILTLFAAFLPYLIGFAYLAGPEMKDITLLGFHKDLKIIFLQFLWLACAVSVPSAFIHIALTRDWECLLPNRLLRPMFKAFIPYMIVFVMFVGVFYLVYITDLYMEIAQGDIWGIVVKSIAILAGHIYVLWTVRAAGLFYRHYGCYFKI